VGLCATAGTPRHAITAITTAATVRGRMDQFSTIQ
jgi:hypothetical protein